MSQHNKDEYLSVLDFFDDDDFKLDRESDPTYYNTEIFVEKVAQEIIALRNIITNLRTLGKGFDGEVSTMSGSWYHVCFGWLRGSESEPYRGYLQIPPQDLPYTLYNLTKLAIDRLRKNLRTEYKILVCSNQVRKDVGHYSISAHDTGIIVFYGESLNEIKDIFRMMVMALDMEVLESRQSIAALKHDEVEPRGTVQYSRDDGTKFQCMSYNLEPGHADVQPRSNKVGSCLDNTRNSVFFN